MKKQALILLALFAVLLSSCASAKMASPEIGFTEGIMAEAPSAAYDSGMEQEMAVEESHSNFTSNVDQVAVQRIVIKNANLSIVVNNPAEAMDYIVTMAEDLGGFVVNSYLYKSYTENGLEVPAADITIRVPAESLTSSLDKIKSLVEDGDKDILNETVTGEDVTREYTDLKSRLRNLENAADQLEKIMDEAYKTDEVLNVYNRLVQVQEEIEVLKGQITYYDEASRLSAITVKIQAQEAIRPLTIGKWQPQGIARDALQALINALKSITSALIWIVIFIIPVLAIIFVPIWLVIRFFIRRRKKRKAQKADQEESTEPEE
ncbi:MAG: DUF4349 domain-containing protein [Anaerolineaceae bacterium]|nr:DUF4349 domain-containing protein [Anaerolineaceae bacterium]